LHAEPNKFGLKSPFETSKIAMHVLYNVFRRNNGSLIDKLAKTNLIFNNLN